ncbi:hypothetical protein [Daejeonia sp. YH14]|uniref:hypothetical protein n=1 Tax=Daejeonia sp. YH14 TaxID=3439042 RepID=UPI003F490D74
MDQKTKGRNSELIRKRNYKLIARFYWYNSIVGLKFEKCIEELEKEFYLSNSRITDLITENAQSLSEFETKKPNEKELKKEIPFFNWIYKPQN